MKIKIKNLREEHGLSQKRLAEIIHTSNKNIWAYENEIATPPLEILVAYANYFNVSTDYLLGRTDELGGVVMPSTSPIAPTLTSEEERLLKNFRAMRPDLQKYYLEMSETFIQGSKTLTEKHKTKRG